MTEKNWITVAISHSLRLDRAQAPAKKILRLRAVPVITRTTVITGKIIYWGQLRLTVEYAANTSGGAVYCAMANAALTGFLPCSRARCGMTAILRGEVEFAHCDITAARQLEIFALIRLRPEQLLRSAGEKAGLQNPPCTVSAGGDSAPAPPPPPCVRDLRRPAAVSFWTRRRRY